MHERNHPITKLSFFSKTLPRSLPSGLSSILDRDDRFTEDKFVKDKTIEKNIHIFWSGSRLRPKHIQRIHKWQGLNKDCKVMVWVDPEYETEIKHQLDLTKVTVILNTTLNLKAHELYFVNQLTLPREDKLAPNYGASSDFYRFKLLNKWGGWYVDTDIIPFDLSKIRINKELIFYVNAERKGKIVGQLSPSIIGASRENPLLSVGLKYFEHLSEVLTDAYVCMLRNKIASVRMLSTMYSTGFALRAALGKIRVNHSSIIQVGTEKDNTINDCDIFDSVASYYHSVPEQSWILNQVVMINENSQLITPIKNVELDDTYVSMMTQDSNVLPDASSLLIIHLRDTVYSKLQPVDLTIKSTDQPPYIRRSQSF